MQTTRRKFLALSASFLATPALANRGVPLSFHNPHTNDKLTLRWTSSKENLDISSFNALCRDWRQNITWYMDPHLLDILADIVLKCEHDGVFSLLSGYRTRATNQILDGSAENSFHLRGQAIDIHHDRLDTHTLFQLASTTTAGGLGYYTPDRGNFVHLDTGPTRTWGAPSVDRVDSNGRLRAIGAQGTPIFQNLNIDLTNPFPLGEANSSPFISMKF